MRIECSWCGKNVFNDPAGGVEYCSAECEHVSMFHAQRVREALENDESPPSKSDSHRVSRRSDRWTPDMMADRIQELAV